MVCGVTVFWQVTRGLEAGCVWFGGSRHLPRLDEEGAAGPGREVRGGVTTHVGTAEQSVWGRGGPLDLRGIRDLH